MPRGHDDELPPALSGDKRVPDFVQERLLEHPLRRQIVDLLDERPGMNKSQICDELDIHTNLLDHHLEKLREAQLVVTRPSAQERETLCFRYEDAHLWENESTRILFGRRASRTVALYLAENPGATTRDIAEALDLSPVTIRHHLRKLKEHELVHQHSAGKTFLYEPDELLELWARHLGQAFERSWEE